jgi:hypothetical protein
MSVDRDRGVMRMTPYTELEFLRDQSIADPKDVYINVPNMALLVSSCFCMYRYFRDRIFNLIATSLK